MDKGGADKGAPDLSHHEVNKQIPPRTQATSPSLFHSLRCLSTMGSCTKPRVRCFPTSHPAPEMGGSTLSLPWHSISQVTHTIFS